MQTLTSAEIQVHFQLFLDITGSHLSGYCVMPTIADQSETHSLVTGNIFGVFQVVRSFV